MSRLERTPASKVALAGCHALAHAMPFALWTLDGAAIGRVAAGLRATDALAGDADLRLDAQVVDLACETVRVIDANPSAVELFRSEDRAALLQPMGYLFSEAPDAARRVLAACVAGRRDHVEDMTIRRFDGRTLDVLLHVTFPAPTEPTTAVLVMMIDVTGRLRSDELMSSIAHEVRQPLSAIVANTDASLRWLGHETPRLEKVRLLMDRIAANARRANEILRRSHRTTREHRHDDEVLDFNAVVAEACEFVRQEAEDRRIGFELTLTDASPHVRGDRVQLQQVIVNLLANAIQAIDQAGVRRREVRLSTSVDGGGVRLSVSDSGPGIPQSDLDRIFTRAFTTKREGMGLGLAICRSIVAAHRGTIGAANSPGGGARFEVLFPSARPASELRSQCRGDAPSTRITVLAEAQA